MNEEMNNNVDLNNEIEQVTDFANSDNQVVAQQETKLEGAKSLGKDVGECIVVGFVIYLFCKAVDFIVDKVKIGIKKFKDSRKAKKEAKAAQQVAAQAPVANVQATQAEVKTEETAQQ